MYKRLINLVILICITIPGFCQVNNVIVAPYINLPKDSVVASQFISSLNKFLQLKEGADTGNNFVWRDERVETFLLLDEMKGIEKNAKLKNNSFYKPYLTNVVKLNGGTYAVAVAYMGVDENTPLLKAGFNLMAHYANNQFYFSSPLKQNTITWRVEKKGDYTFYFKNKLNEEKASSYMQTVAFYDKKLRARGQQTHIYCCDDFPEVLKVAGVDYNATYNGFNSNTNLGVQTADKKIIVNASDGGGFNDFDPHDLWHDRLHRVVSTDSINKPVDEGCAFLYGGSWGMSWADILKKFKEKMGARPMPIGLRYLKRSTILEITN